MPEPRYIGDGVYATVSSDGYSVIVTTGHHEVHRADNVIYLEVPVARSLKEYLDEFLAK